MPIRRTPSSFFSFSNGIPIVAGAIVALSLLWAFWPIITFTFPSTHKPINFGDRVNTLKIIPRVTPPSISKMHGFNLTHDPSEPSFYDDPELSYTIEKPVKNWDAKRKEWLRLHPSFIAGVDKRVMLVTGSVRDSVLIIGVNKNWDEKLGYKRKR